MDRRNWPWRKKSISGTGFIMSPNAAVDSSVSPSSNTSPSVGSGADKPALPTVAEKERHLSLLENAKAFEALAWKEQAEQKARELVHKLEDAEKDLVSKESTVKQHAKVADEAVSGWEKAEAEALSLKQELTTSAQRINLLEGQVTELEEALKASMTHVAELEEALKASLKQLRQTQEDQQQRTKEAIDRKMHEWGNVKAEMEEIEDDLRQRMLAAEAQSCAMAKSLEERARAITDSQEGKARAEMEAGLLEVKLESQATEMTAIRYELKVLTKELEIRNQESEHSRKAADAAYKQHMEDVKKISKLDSECQRLRNLVRKRLPGPAAIAQMKMEADKSEQSKRRRSLGSVGVGAPTENGSYCHDLSEKLRAMEEETNILRETLAKKSVDLQSARLLCARTANKLSGAEEQLESLQGTPKSVKSTQSSALDGFFLRSCTANSDMLDDEVSCAESWASALITELAQLKKPKQEPDSCALDASSEQFSETPKKSPKDNINEVLTPGATRGSPSPQDYSTLRSLAGKDAQLQSANLMCKNAMAKLASAEAKLGGTWISENPRSNVEESVNSVGEAHGIMSKLDRILDDMRIAAASVGDMTDDDNSENGLPGLSPTSAKDTVVAPYSGLECMKEKQAIAIGELQTQVSVLEAAKTELQGQLGAKADEIKQVKGELEVAHVWIEELKMSELDSKSHQEKLLAEEEAKRSEVQVQLEAKQSEISKLQSNLASLGVELADQCKKHEATIAKCEELDKKLQSYVNREHNMASSCRFDEELEARAKKEREVAAAKEKLAECQRTILVLGKQLTAFTSPSSASFDSAMTSEYGTMDANHYEDVDHAHKVRSRMRQQRPMAYNSVNPHDDGPECLTYLNTHDSETRKRPLAYNSVNPHDDGTSCHSYSNIHTSDSAKRFSHLNGGHFSKPRRIQSDLSYRRGSANPVPGVTYSVAEHLQMDDGVSSFYDSRTESAMSSPSSQYTSPNDTIRVQRSGYEGCAMGSGVRTSLAKSLESMATSTTVNGKNGDESGNGNVGTGRKSVVRVAAASAVKTGGHGGGGGGGKGSKSLSRFFGRSKK
ncbi:hypothetical protein L7F22_017436 [Adiantum nelumboides]|nr:hypothetical protein [Adiantum nelumboides]